MNDWTIMIYMAGDNDLSVDMISAINEIQGSVAGAKNPKSKISFTIQIDLEHPLVKSRYYHIKALGDPTKPEEIPVENSSTPKAILDFVDKSIKENPANNYALIISAHSDAFQERTLLLDENPYSITTIPELAEKLGDFAKKYLPKKQFDILGFESCVMNTFEVMYEFLNVADFWIGSQGSIPNYTWDYRGIVTDLLKQQGSSLNSRQVVRTILHKIKKYNKEYAFAGRSIDVSACKLDPEKFENAGTKIGTLANTITNLLVKELEVIGTNTNKRINFVQQMLLKVHFYSQTFMFDQSVDIKDMCRLFKTECTKTIREVFALCGIELAHDENNLELNNQEEIFLQDDFSAASLSEILSESEKLSERAKFYLEASAQIYRAADRLLEEMRLIPIKVVSTGLDYRFSRGISLFMPWSRLAYCMSLEKYKTLKFIRKDSGKDWLFFLHCQCIFTARFKPDSPNTLFRLDTADKNLQKFSFDRANFEPEGFRDNPKLSRGFSEYVHYFGRAKNFFPDLDVEDDLEEPTS